MSQEHHSAHSAERVALREQYALRIVQPEEEGRNILNQAAGIYGFTGAPSSEELPLFAKPVYRCFEVHKVPGGEVLIAGYVTEAQRAAYMLGAEPITLLLYPDPRGESSRLIALPLSRIDRRRPPLRDDGNPMPVDVAPAG